MRTTGAELHSEAAIYAAGRDLVKQEMLNFYAGYCLDCEEMGEEPDDFQRWAEREGYGADHWRMHVWDGAGKLLNAASCEYPTKGDAVAAMAEAQSRPNAARIDLEAWIDKGGDEIHPGGAWTWNDRTGEWDAETA